MVRDHTIQKQEMLDISSDDESHDLTLLVIGNKLIGLELIGSVFASSLLMRVVFADFQSQSQGVAKGEGQTK